FINEITNFFSCCYRIFKGFRRCVQAAKQQTVRLSENCVSKKYLWALPTPTTFEKVDQTFIIAWLNCELNHNLLILPPTLEYKCTKMPDYGKSVIGQQF
ncbi:hypothetical protein, partial [uncultured Ruminococcus sp.]|uniref:hypothetical protein n=1 Tax=uncultured Ruminococcus sp. TaxID=165186 RepID=UPI002671EDEE